MGSQITAIHTAAAPVPAGHYSQGISHGGVVHVSGQLPLDPVSGLVEDGGIGPQTERTLRNVEAILVAGGASLSSLLSVTVYITDRSLWPAVNEVYARLLGEHRPARAVIPVPALRTGCLIEIQAVAAVHG
jgi:reactive intermediate/imine deaminase